MSYATGCHTVFHNRYHIVWVTKYRYKGSGRNIARADTDHHSAGLQGTGGTDRLGRFVQRACPHVRRDTTAYRGQRRRSTCLKGARRIAFRWSSQNFATVTGVAISGRGATSALPAATSQTRRYFSISSIMNLPASAGSYSVQPEDDSGGDTEGRDEGVRASVVTGVDAAPVFEPSTASSALQKAKTNHSW